MTQNSGMKLWMTREQLKKYAELSAQLVDLNKEHMNLIKRGLAKRALAKQISEAEVKRLLEVNGRIRKLYSERRQLEEKNPILPENVDRARGKKD